MLFTCEGCSLVHLFTYYFGEVLGEEGEEGEEEGDLTTAGRQAGFFFFFFFLEEKEGGL